MKVLIVQFSDGGHNLYFINGVRDPDIQHDQDLHKRMTGNKVEAIESLWINPENDTDEQPAENWWNVDQETVAELFAHIQAYPYLIDADDMAIIERASCNAIPRWQGV